MDETNEAGVTVRIQGRHSPARRQRNIHSERTHKVISCCFHYSFSLERESISSLSVSTFRDKGVKKIFSALKQTKP